MKQWRNLVGDLKNGRSRKEWKEGRREGEMEWNGMEDGIVERKDLADRTSAKPWNEPFIVGRSTVRRSPAKWKWRIKRRKRLCPWFFTPLMAADPWIPASWPETSILCPSQAWWSARELWICADGNCTGGQSSTRWGRYGNNERWQRFNPSDLADDSVKPSSSRSWLAEWFGTSISVEAGTSACPVLARSDEKRYDVGNSRNTYVSQTPCTQLGWWLVLTLVRTDKICAEPDQNDADPFRLGISQNARYSSRLIFFESHWVQKWFEHDERIQILRTEGWWQPYETAEKTVIIR